MTAIAVVEALADSIDDVAGAPAMVDGDLVEVSHTVTAEMPLGTALHALGSAPGTGLPLLDTDRRQVLGRLPHQSALRAAHPAPAQSRPPDAAVTP
ncbi:hypothetical protein [Streptomyces sp. NPDC006552]|uniref:hypothetical protein n=1 Tax=Streptomyces sp. NPDC006552 TaxID=3157179 RepID=UPI0033A290DF